METRYALKKTSYKPPRGLRLDESDSLISINALLKPWGFRLSYWGYDKISMNYVYEFITTKDVYEPLESPLVILYHHADMTEEEWLSELKARLNSQGKQTYDTAWARFDRARKNKAKNYMYKRRRRGVSKCTKGQSNTS